MSAADPENGHGLRRGPRHAHAADHRDAAEAAGQGRAAQALIDHCLDRLAESGVETADRQRPLARRPDRGASRAGASIRASSFPTSAKDCSTRAAASRSVLPLSARDPFFICNTDALWIEGPRSNLARLAEAFDPDDMDIAAPRRGERPRGRRRLAAAISPWTEEGRLESREDRLVAPFVYTGVGIIKPELFAARRRRSLPPRALFLRAAAEGRLYGVRLDGLWIHVGRPEVDRRGGARDRALDPLTPVASFTAVARKARRRV